MAVETGRKLGDPFLREACKEVEQASAPETGALVEDLADTLALWRKTTGYGRGIAAPQIGVAKRVIFLQLRRHRALPGFAGNTHEVQAGELRNLSELLQHEIDHLDGILCIDRVTDLRTICTKEE